MNKADLSQFKLSDSVFLDAEEKQLLAGIEGSHSIFNEKLVEQYSTIAKEQRNRNKSVSMRLNTEDFLRAKAKGLEEGIPYQVLLASVIHKWLHGKLKEA